MPVARTLVLTVLVSLVVPAAARADWFLTPFYGVTFGSQTTLVDLDDATDTSKQVFGGSVSLMGSGILGLEADFGYAPRFFQRDEGASLVVTSSLLTLAGNVVVAAPLSWTRESLRPYAVAGVGLMRASIDDALSTFRVRDNLLAVDFGGGVMGFFTDRTGVRFDLRYFRGFGDPGLAPRASFGRARLSSWRASIGVVLRRSFR